MTESVSKYKAGTFPKTCSCGMVYTQESWERLEFGFVQEPVFIAGEKLCNALEGRLCMNHGALGSHVTVELAE